MLLYIMRHGPAEDHASSRRDADRPLTPGGRALVQRMAAELLGARQPELDRIVASPLLRARETAELVRDAAFPQAQVDLDDAVVSGGPLLMGLVRRLVAAGSDALIVGHQPTVGELVQELSASTSPRLAGFSTAMIVELAHGGGAEEEALEGSFRLGLVLDPRR